MPLEPLPPPVLNPGKAVTIELAQAQQGAAAQHLQFSHSSVSRGLTNAESGGNVTVQFSKSVALRAPGTRTELSAELSVPTNAVQRDIATLNVQTGGPHAIQHVALLLDGQVIGSVSDQKFAPLNQLKVEFDTRLVPNGRHTLAVKVLDRIPAAGGSEDYNRVETQPIFVDISNPLWVKNWADKVERRLLIEFGTTFQAGTYEATIFDPQNKEIARIAPRALEQIDGAGQGSVAFPAQDTILGPTRLGYVYLDVVIHAVDTQKQEHHLLKLRLPCAR